MFESEIYVKVMIADNVFKTTQRRHKRVYNKFCKIQEK